MNLLIYIYNIIKYIGKYNKIKMSSLQEYKMFLEIISKKLLFPNKLLISLKNIAGLKTLSYDMQKYNNNIIKARSLLEEINKLNNFEGIWNSSVFWNMSIIKLNASFITWRDEILKNCIGDNFIEKSFLSQARVFQKNILFFLNIDKKNDVYILNINNDKFEIEYVKICDLLPRVSYINKERMFVPESIHCLDISDLIDK